MDGDHRSNYSADEFHQQLGRINTRRRNAPSSPADRRPNTSRHPERSALMRGSLSARPNLLIHQTHQAASDFMNRNQVQEDRRQDRTQRRSPQQSTMTEYSSNLLGQGGYGIPFASSSGHGFTSHIGQPYTGQVQGHMPYQEQNESQYPGSVQNNMLGWQPGSSQYSDGGGVHDTSLWGPRSNPFNSTSMIHGDDNQGWSSPFDTSRYPMPPSTVAEASSLPENITVDLDPASMDPVAPYNAAEVSFAHLALKRAEPNVSLFKRLKQTDSRNIVKIVQKRLGLPTKEIKARLEQFLTYSMAQRLLGNHEHYIDDALREVFPSGTYTPTWVVGLSLSDVDQVIIKMQAVQTTRQRYLDGQMFDFLHFSGLTNQLARIILDSDGDNCNTIFEYLKTTRASSSR